MAKETIKETKKTEKKDIKGVMKSLKLPNFLSKQLKKINDKIMACCNVSHNLRQRILTAVIAVPFIIFAIYVSKFLFNAFLLVIVVLAAFEWQNLIKDVKNKASWTLAGVVYIALPFLLFITIHDVNNGPNIILWMLCVVWATDIAGMLVGQALQGPKLAPKISPNKTWSGLFGGIISSMMIGFVSSLMFSGGVMFFVFFSGLLAVVEQMGDLFESKIKRHFGVKDSGNILPGHGGILDRIDGLIFVIPVVFLMIVLSLGRLF